MTIQHSHDIDSKLHDDCPACDLIRERARGLATERQADTAAAKYAKLARLARGEDE